MPKRHRKMKGGFLDSLSSTLSSWGSSISQSASNAYNKAKNATTTAYSSATGTTTPSYAPVSPAPAPVYTPTSTYGGKKRSRKMRGGNIAANAAPISDIQTAKPHNWVGGKRKTRKHKK